MALIDNLKARHPQRSLQMTYRKNLLASVGLCAAVGAASVWAQGELETSVPPQPQNYGGIQVINGGVDLDQADAIERIQSRYNLRVEISGRGGDYYVADNLKLMQGGDLVAEIPQAGPWLLMDVVPGRYTLLGTFGGTEVKRDVLVPASGTKVSWVVPSSIQ
jgi:hypothetical protein